MEEKKATPPTTRFELGLLVMTSGIKAALTSGEIACAVARHVQGDWGVVGPEDWQENENALAEGWRIFSVYETANGLRHYVITEADRSSTCVLLPEEY